MSDDLDVDKLLQEIDAAPTDSDEDTPEKDIPKTTKFSINFEKDEDGNIWETGHTGGDENW